MLFSTCTGLIYPLDKFPEGTSSNRARAAALKKAPLRGPIKVLVVLVDFPDKPFASTSTKQHFEVGQPGGHRTVEHQHGC